MAFLRKNFPHYNERMVTVPGVSFQYNLPGNQHGIPNKAKEIRLTKMAVEKKYDVSTSSSNCKAPPNEDNLKVGKPKKKAEKIESDLVHDWQKAAAGKLAEQNVHDMLQRKFSNEPCLLVHEFKENDLVKESLKTFFFTNLKLAQPSVHSKQDKVF